MPDERAYARFAVKDRREAIGWRRYWDSLSPAERRKWLAEDPANGEPWPEPYAAFLPADAEPLPEPVAVDPETERERRKRQRELRERVPADTPAQARQRPSNTPAGRRKRYEAEKARKEGL